MSTSTSTTTSELPLTFVSEATFLMRVLVAFTSTAIFFLCVISLISLLKGDEPSRLVNNTKNCVTRFDGFGFIRYSMQIFIGLKCAYWSYLRIIANSKEQVPCVNSTMYLTILALITLSGQGLASHARIKLLIVDKDVKSSSEMNMISNIFVAFHVTANVSICIGWTFWLYYYGRTLFIYGPCLELNPTPFVFFIYFAVDGVLHLLVVIYKWCCCCCYRRNENVYSNNSSTSINYGGNNTITERWIQYQKTFLNICALCGMSFLLVGVTVWLDGIETRDGKARLDWGKYDRFICSWCMVIPGIELFILVGSGRLVIGSNNNYNNNKL
jgi:hypothetical protein